MYYSFFSFNDFVLLFNQMKIIGVENTIMDELFEDLPLWRKEEHKTPM